jgi:GNAT superfamily N-acetyltransferase
VEEGVREATRADLARLVSLARAAIAELTPMRGGRVWAARDARREPLEHGLAAVLDDPTRRAVLGTIDGVAVGYGVVRVEQLGDGACLGVVDDMFVEEGARGVGVGEAMMDDLVEWCRVRGCVGVDVIALPGHRAAKNFFEEAGFTARKIVMHRRLGDP